jgi:1-deoxy-D-xylulose-5-phosphate synthase
MPFDVETGHALNPPIGRQIQTYCTDALLEEMADNDKIIAITPSTKYATDLDRVADAFPGRVLDPGMSEQHALSMAAGMALDGARPVVMFQSTFMQRAFDQLVHDIAFGGADVLIVASRTGFAGYDNATHHGLIDFGYLKAIPNLRVLFPRNCESLYETMKRELISPQGPTLILFPYGFEKDYCSEESSTGPDKNSDVGIVSLGNTLAKANEVSHQLHNDGITCSTYCIEEIKPFPKSKVVELATRHKYLFSIEEYVLDGGLNESISSALQSCSKAPFYAPFGLECKFFPGGSAEELADYSGLNSTEIYKDILKCMKES